MWPCHQHQRSARRHLAGELYESKSGLLRSGDSVAGTKGKSLQPQSVTYVLGTLCYPCVRAGPTLEWRRRRDSNPRDPFESNGFQDRRFQPLTHSSVSKYIVQLLLAGFCDNFDPCCCILVQDVTKLSPIPSSFATAVPFGIEICMRIAHGCNDSRMSEQLLDCHYIHAAIHQPGSERVTQRVPRHTLDSRLSACQSETRVEIDKRFSGFKVVENEFVLSAERPKLQNPARFRVYRNRPNFVRFIAQTQ